LELVKQPKMYLTNERTNGHCWQHMQTSKIFKGVYRPSNAFPKGIGCV